MSVDERFSDVDWVSRLADWSIRVFAPTQKRAGLRGELCALLVHRWVHKQPVLF